MKDDLTPVPGLVIILQDTMPKATAAVWRRNVSTIEYSIVRFQEPPKFFTPPETRAQRRKKQRQAKTKKSK